MDDARFQLLLDHQRRVLLLIDCAHALLDEEPEAAAVALPARSPSRPPIRIRVGGREGERAGTAKRACGAFSNSVLTGAAG